MEFGRELVGEGVARPALAGAQGISALDHETGNDPVKLQAVKKGLTGQWAQGSLRQADKVGAGERGAKRVQLADDRSLGNADDRVEPVLGRQGPGARARRDQRDQE